MGTICGFTDFRARIDGGSLTPAPASDAAAPAPSVATGSAAAPRAVVLRKRRRPNCIASSWRLLMGLLPLGQKDIRHDGGTFRHWQKAWRRRRKPGPTDRFALPGSS